MLYIFYIYITKVRPIVVFVLLFDSIQDGFIKKSVHARWIDCVHC